MAASKPVEFRNFSGTRPRASDVRLAVQEAIYARDVDLRKGLLRPRARQTVWNYFTDPHIVINSEDDPETIFRFHREDDDQDFWMFWTSDVDVARGPVDSTDQRHYYTGDEYPKMFTASSVDNTTPPYPELADTKYPYTWFKLGVPAPADAPVIDESTLTTPGEGSVGLITEVTASNLVMYANASIDSSSGLVVTSAGREALLAGSGTTNIRTHSGGSVRFSCLRDGTRVRVTEIIDEDHVRVVVSGRTGYIEDLGVDLTHQWRWDNGLANTHRDAPLTRPSGGNVRKSYFLMPEVLDLEIEDHILRVDDVIRISGSAQPMAWDSTSTLVTSPVPSGPFIGYRTLTRPDSQDIVFNGSVGFVIERNGEEVDPAVPPTALYEISVRSYMYTYVTALGEESAPSPPSPVYTVRDGDPVNLTTFTAPPTERMNIDRIWIYRTNTGSSGTVVQFVGELAVADIGDGFEDTELDEDLDELLETEGWDTPREDMRGIVAMPNGMMAGFSGNRLCFSVPGFPHAWPRDYEQLLDYDIVGLEVYENSVYVTTTGKPYIATGTHPAQMSLRRVETLQACLDKRSVVNVGSRILYVSNEGLISGGADGFYNVTDKHYTKDQWQRVIGRDTAEWRFARAWYHDSQYILHATYSDGLSTGSTQLIFDFRDPEMRVTAFSEPVVAAFADPDTAELYYIVPPEAEPVGHFDEEDPPPAGARYLLRWDYDQINPSELDPEADPITTEGRWVSGTVVLPYPMSFSCARVLCRRVEGADESYGHDGFVYLSIYGKAYDSTDQAEDDEAELALDVPIMEGNPSDPAWEGEQRNRPFRLAQNVVVDAVYIELRIGGNVEVEGVQLAQNMRALEGS